MKVVCACSDCKYQNDTDNYCHADKIILSSHSVMTVYHGRQDFHRCKMYKMSEESKRLYDELKEFMEGV